MRAALLLLVVGVCVGCSSPGPAPAPTLTPTARPSTPTPEPLPPYIYIGEGGDLRTPDGSLYAVEPLSRAALAPDGRFAAAIAGTDALVMVNTLTADAVRHDLGAEVLGPPLWLPGSDGVIVQAAVREPQTERVTQTALIRVGVGGGFEPLLQLTASPQGEVARITHIPAEGSAVLLTPAGSARLLDLTTGASTPLPAVPLAFAAGQVLTTERLTPGQPTPLSLGPATGEGQLITPNDFFYTVHHAAFAPGSDALALIASRPGDPQREVFVLRELTAAAPTIVSLPPPTPAPLSAEGIAWVPGELLVAWANPAQQAAALWRYPSDGALPQFVTVGTSPSAPR